MLFELKRVKNFSELQVFIKKYSLDKEQLLYYLIEAGNKNLLIKELLNKNMYTKEDIGTFIMKYNNFNNTYAMDMFNIYVGNDWKKSTDIEQIIKKTNNMPKEIYERLEYFYENNETIFFRLLERLNPVSLYNGLLYNPQNKEFVNILIDLAIEFPDKFFEAGVVLEGKIYKEFTKRRSALLESKDAWKRFADKGDVLMLGYSINDSNKWEVFEYLLNNDQELFDKVCRKRADKDGKYRKSEIYNRYKDRFENVPLILKEFLKEIEIYLAKREENLEKSRNSLRMKKEAIEKSWYDEKGIFIKLFTIEGKEISHESEYYTICDKFLDCDLGIGSFAKKYKISDKAGFKKMLDKIAANDEELKQKIEVKMKKNQEYYMIKFNELVDKAIVSYAEVEDMIVHSFTYSLSDIIQLTKQYRGMKDYVQLANNIIEYYDNRLSSYTEEKSVENLTKLLTENEIRFILGNDLYNLKQAGKNVEIDRVLTTIFSGAKTELSASTYKKLVASVRLKIAKYNAQYKSKEYLAGERSFMDKDGILRKVDQKLVENGEFFAKDRNIYICSMTMRMILHAFILGNIPDGDNCACTIDNKNIR